MNFRFGAGAATAAMILLAAAPAVCTAAGPQPAFVAQAATPDPAEAKDQMMTHCSRYHRAYARLSSVKSELSRLQMAFIPTDDIRPKLDALVDQTNDAMQTAQRRLQSCPANLR